MDKTKLMNVGLIGGIVGTITSGVCLILSECKRHKMKDQLIDTEFMLGVSEIEGRYKDVRISHLEKENRELKSNCNKEEES